MAVQQPFIYVKMFAATTKNSAKHIITSVCSSSTRWKASLFRFRSCCNCFFTISTSFLIFSWATNCSWRLRSCSSVSCCSRSFFSSKSACWITNRHTDVSIHRKRQQHTWIRKNTNVNIENLTLKYTNIQSIFWHRKKRTIMQSVNIIYVNCCSTMVECRCQR